MFITQNKFNTMKDRISTLEDQVADLTAQKLEERDERIATLTNLDDKIIYLEDQKRQLTNDIKDLRLKTKREEEDLQHTVKIVLEKNELALAKDKQELEKIQIKEIAKIKDEYRDKQEAQLDKRGSEMREMYDTVLNRLTNVTGVLTKPSGSNTDVSSKK